MSGTLLAVLMTLALTIDTAAGAAAHLAHTDDVSPRGIHVARLQNTLSRADVIIEGNP